MNFHSLSIFICFFILIHLASAVPSKLLVDAEKRDILVVRQEPPPESAASSASAESSVVPPSSSPQPSSPTATPSSSIGDATPTPAPSAPVSPNPVAPSQTIPPSAPAAPVPVMPSPILAKPNNTATKRPRKSTQWLSTAAFSFVLIMGIGLVFLIYMVGIVTVGIGRFMFGYRVPGGWGKESDGFERLEE
ncbi:uncharacterized protein VTP21DRAFT_6804 [Calcarisporiella thermophila]|uniref:uncharacterized protein n=1 Tax=Calcarisporiella thermophila TaxID=911321 RepID=UPI003742A095